MNWERRIQSRDGKRFFHAGFGTMDAVGTEHPASEVPMQEGVRLMITKAIDRWWMIVLAGLAVRKVKRRFRRRK